MNVLLVTPPTFEPVDLASLKLHLRLDSNSFSDSIDETQSIAPGEKTPATYTGTPVEVLGYTAVVEFACGAIIAGGTLDIKIQDCDTLSGTYADWGTAFTQVTTDGMLTSAALAIGSTPAYVANGIFTYFIIGVGYSKPANAAGTSPATSTADDTIPQGRYGAVAFEIGQDNVIDAIDAAGNDTGYDTAVLALAGLALVAVQANHVRIGMVTAMRSAGGAFVFGVTPLDAINTIVAYTQATLKGNFNTTYEKAYTGAKRYIKTVAVVGAQDCSFATSVIRLAATSIEDDWLNDAIAEARQYVEDVTRRGILTQTWNYYLNEWPSGDAIKIPFGNLQDNDKATGTITSNATNVTAADTVTIDTKVYTFVASPTVEGDVDIGATAAATLDNLKAAINHTGTPDTDYKCAACHPTVEATTNTDTVQTLQAIIGGVGGNSIVLAKSAATLTVSAATLIGGATTIIVKYRDADSLETTLDVTTDYIVETNGAQCGRIVLPYGESWPSDTLYPSKPITIQFVCGWTTAALVSRNLRAMIKLHCADKYKHRGEGITGHIFVEDKAFYRIRMLETLWDEF